MEQKTQSKYILLEKPMFFNSKLNQKSQENKSETQTQNQNSQNQNIKNIQNNSPQKYRTFLNDPNETAWHYRYERKGYTNSNLLQEDSLFFKEHIENLQKKSKFDFESLQKSNNIKVYLNNKEIPQEIKNSFNEISFDSHIQSNLKKLHYDLMTPIQQIIIPYILLKKDCLGCAQTGSGKTIAFLIPLINLMLKEGPPKDDNKYLKTNSNYNLSCSYPVMLILVPTRELAEQIFKEARKVCHKTGIIVSRCYGGVKLDNQIRELKQGCDIVIGTPGRIIELIEKRFLYLKLIQYLVIDESDRMLDMGFEHQMNDIVFNSQMPDKNNRVNYMFSATIPKNVIEISKKFMREECYLISNKNNLDKNEYNANENVEQKIYYVEDNDKIGKLHEIFQKIQGNAIIFLETKKSVDNLENFLSKRNYNVLAIHGDKPQIQRQEAIRLFSNGEVPILIATDVASRGLDFPNVSYVFNFDMPKNIEDYIHRIGRTGRVGNKGMAISFYNEKNKVIAEDLVKEMKKAKQEIPDFLEKFDYDNLDDDNYFFNGDYKKKRHGNNNNFHKRGHGRGGRFNRGFNNRGGFNNNNYNNNNFNNSNFNNSECWRENFN